MVKKIKLGIYSVSPGMEVICDSAESYNEGCNLHAINCSSYVDNLLFFWLVHCVYGF